MGSFFSISPKASFQKVAADWIARSDRGLSPQEQEELAAWEAADPRHAAELARLRNTWNVLGATDEVPGMVDFARRLERKALRRAHRPAWTPTWIAAGMAAVVVVAWTLGWTPATLKPQAPDVARYSVIPSSAQRLTLSDGSIVELNGDSAVEPVYSTTERQVRLLRGEAHFDVVKDLARPFSVVAGAVVVRAVGTAFNVRIEPAAVEVLVTKGKVQVDDSVRGETVSANAAVLVGDVLPAKSKHSISKETHVLVAGQKAVIANATPTAVVPVAVTAAEIARSLAWQGTQFIFDRTPLADAVAAFNRFNRLQLILEDASLRERNLGGAFRADQVEGFVRLIETGFDIQVERRGDHTLVLRSAR